MGLEMACRGQPLRPYRETRLCKWEQPLRALRAGGRTLRRDAGRDRPRGSHEQAQDSIKVVLRP